MTLWDVAAGMKAVIAGYDSSLEKTLRERLVDLGFSEGATVECLRHAPFSGPHVFQMESSVFALEKEVAVLVTVRTGTAS